MSPSKRTATKNGTTIESLVESAPEPLEPVALVREDGEPFAEPILHELIVSYLVWETGTTNARESAAQITRSFVDINELRVSLEEELAALVPGPGKFAYERARRMLSTLQDVFHKQHAMSLAELAGKPKREARAFLESLDSIPSYVSSRVALRSLGVHAVPCDARLLDLLQSQEIATEHNAADAAGSWLERQIRASESARAHEAFEALTDWSGGSKSTKRGGK